MSMPATPEIEYRSRVRTHEFVQMQFCEVCTARFFIREHDAARVLTCSRRCDRKRARARFIEDRKLAVERLEGHQPLTPYESARLRSHIFQCVARQIEVAHAFVMQQPLSPSDPPPMLNANQVRVFTSLLNKVVPDLSHTFTQMADDKRDLSELTREELERIVGEAKIISPAPTSEDADP
jgi:hypothetical protein